MTLIVAVGAVIALGLLWLASFHLVEAASRMPSIGWGSQNVVWWALLPVLVIVFVVVALYSLACFIYYENIYPTNNF